MMVKVKQMAIEPLSIAEGGLLPYVLGKHCSTQTNKTAGRTGNRPSLRTTKKRLLAVSDG